MQRALYTIVKNVRSARATGALFALAAGAVLLLGGCSSNDKTPTAPPPPPPPPPAAVVKTVRITPSTATVAKDSTVVLTAAGLDSAGAVVASATTFTWSSSDTSVATVSAGTVTGRKAGSATITARFGLDSATAIAGTASVTVTQPVAAIQHVFIVSMLQKDFATIFPASGASPMPFLDSLAHAGGRATRYYGNASPSIGNFYMLAVGDTVTHDDNDTTVFTGDNIFRQLIGANKTWKVYADSLPSVGYIGPDRGLYIRHHNVATLISDVRGDTAQRRNIVPLTQLAGDVSGSRLPNFGMIVPNDCNNSRTCTLTAADAFLRSTLTPLLNDSTFKQSGMLIILFDRSNISTVNGGGRVPWVVVSSRAKAGFVDSTTVFQHQSTLRLALNTLGITTVPGAGATAPDMKAFLNLP